MLVVLTSVPAYVLSPGTAAPQLLQQRQVTMMAKKKKVDDRVWLPKRTSEFGREVDVALQLVSRAAAGMEKASVQVANLASQALVCDGIASEFPGDVIIASASAAGGDADAVVELVNELGATTPCVNEFDP